KELDERARLVLQALVLALVVAVDVQRLPLVRDRSLGEEVVLQLLGEGGIAAADPFEHHRRVLLLLVAVVDEDRAELRVFAGVGPLVVPVVRLQLLHERDDRPVHVPRLVRMLVGRLVVSDARHCASPFSLKVLRWMCWPLACVIPSRPRRAIVSARRAQGNVAFRRSPERRRRTPFRRRPRRRRPGTLSPGAPSRADRKSVV